VWLEFRRVLFRSHKKVSSKKGKKRPKEKKQSDKKDMNNKREIEEILVENFTSLQKVMTSLSEKFNELTKRIDQLLGLFEDSAKALVKKDFTMDKENEMNIKVLSRMDEMLEQNKIIAKSLMMFFEQPDEKFEKRTTRKEEEFIPPKPIEGKFNKNYLRSPKGGEEEIKSPNKRREELGMKNPFVKEEGEDEWEPEFDISN